MMSLDDLTLFIEEYHCYDRQFDAGYDLNKWQQGQLLMLAGIMYQELAELKQPQPGLKNCPNCGPEPIDP